jgi:hypothetical protein
MNRTGSEGGGGQEEGFQSLEGSLFAQKQHICASNQLIGDSIPELKQARARQTARVLDSPAEFNKAGRSASDQQQNQPPSQHISVSNQPIGDSNPELKQARARKTAPVPPVLDSSAEQFNKGISTSAQERYQPPSPPSGNFFTFLKFFAALVSTQNTLDALS